MPGRATKSSLQPQRHSDHLAGNALQTVSEAADFSAYHVLSVQVCVSWVFSSCSLGFVVYSTRLCILGFFKLFFGFCGLFYTFVYPGFFQVVLWVLWFILHVCVSWVFSSCSLGFVVYSTRLCILGFFKLFFGFCGLFYTFVYPGFFQVVLWVLWFILHVCVSWVFSSCSLGFVVYSTRLCILGFFKLFFGFCGLFYTFLALFEVVLGLSLGVLKGFLFF